MKTNENGKKIRVHAITYVLIITFLLLIITAIILFTPSREGYFMKRYNNEVLKIFSANNDKDKEAQALANYYNEIKIDKDTQKMFKIIKPRELDKYYNKHQYDNIQVFVRGGFYSREFLFQFNLFLKELKEHGLYKEETYQKYTGSKNKFVVNIIMQEKLTDQENLIKEFYKKAKVDEYDYDKSVKAPIFTVMYRGKAVNLESRDLIFQNVANDYKTINTRAKLYLDNIQAHLDKEISK